MPYWKSLEERCLESSAINAGPYLATASSILGPAQLSRLISWMAAHELLNDPGTDRFRASIQGVLCDEIRALDLDIGDVNGQFLVAIADKCRSTLEFLRLGCSFKVYDQEISTLMHNLSNIRYLDIRELKIELPTGVLSGLKSPRLERVFLQLYIRDKSWNELEWLVEQNPTIQSLRINVRGRTLQNEDSLLLKMAHHLSQTLTELDLHNFSCEKGWLSYMLITCRNLKTLRLTGSIQLDVDTMIRVRQICKWEIFELTFQISASKETYEALKYVPASLTEIALNFGPSPQTASAHGLVVNVLCSLPNLKRVKYHSRSLNDSWFTNLLDSMSEDILRNLECLDIGLCDSITDPGLHTVSATCPNLKEFYLHSDTTKYNRVATCLPLSRWFDRSTDHMDPNRLTILYLNYFKQVSSDFLHIVAVECVNLEELHLASVRCVNNGLLKFLAVHCAKLHTVDVMNCWSVEDGGIIELAKRTPLINLNVGMCFKLTEASVFALAENCPYLERFIYHGVPQLKRSAAVEALKKACQKKLKTYWYQWMG